MVSLDKLRAHVIVDAQTDLALLRGGPVLMPSPSRIRVARDLIDFRKGIAGLAAICEVHLREEPLSGTLFVFVNRRRDGLKALVWTHGGFVILFKKLEKGGSVGRAPRRRS